MARIVVIGAGLGGMAVAARLRVKGHEITVIEAADTCGGRVGTVRRDGFAFDTGPATLTLPAVYRDLFLKTGGPLEEAVDLLPVDPAADYRFADGSTVSVPGVGAGRVAVALGEALGGPTASQWRALMARAGQMWAAVRQPLLESPVAGPGDLRPLADRATLRTLAPWSTLRGLGRATLTDPRARMLLDRYAATSGTDPRRAASLLVTEPYLEATFGVWHVAGGMGRLADALHTRLLERRVTVRPATAATEILQAGGRVSGVRLADGEALPAEVVVSAVGVPTLMGTPGNGSSRPPTPRRRRHPVHGTATLVVMLAVRGEMAGLAPRTVWLPEDPDSAFDQIIARRARLADDPAITLSVPDDPAMHPVGGRACTVSVEVPRHSEGGRDPGTVDWDAPGLAESYADSVLARLAAHGVDLTDRVLWRMLRTPADVHRATGSPGGSSHGWAGHRYRGTYRQIPNTTAVPGLFLVGGSVHPGAGLPRVGLSAQIVAELIGRA